MKGATEMAAIDDDIIERWTTLERQHHGQGKMLDAIIARLEVLENRDDSAVRVLYLYVRSWHDATAVSIAERMHTLFPWLED